MASKGNSIIVSAQPRGVFHEGYVSGALYPGTIVQPITAPDDTGRVTWGVFNRDADGDRPAGPIAILIEDALQGKLMTQAYADGDRCRVYCPLPGEELNALFGNAAGTADDIAFGDLMIVDDGTGEIIETTGTVEDEPFLSMSTITDPTADELLWVMKT